MADDNRIRQDSWVGIEHTIIEPMPDENGIRVLDTEQMTALSGRYVLEFYSVDVLPPGALVWGDMRTGGTIRGYFVLTPVEEAKNG